MRHFKIAIKIYFMIKINEWLPNPIGNDSQNEWIELYNDSGQIINLNNWSIISQNKSYKIKNIILGPQKFLVLNRQQTKLQLLNKNGELKLFDSLGNLIDEIRFWGSAPEGKSFSRFGNVFLFSEPTPGQKNIQTQQFAQIINYPEGTIFYKTLPLKDFIVLGLALGILLAFTFWFIIKNNAEIKKSFFD